MGKQLGDANRKYKSDREKASKSAADKAAKEEREMKEKEVADSSARILHMKASRALTMDWTQAGHTAIPSYEREKLGNDLKQDKQAFLKKPFILTDPQLQLAKLLEVMKAWNSQYAQFCKFQNIDFCQHELNVKQGIDELTGLWSAMVPDNLCFTTGLPSVQSMLATQHSFGYMPTFVNRNFEPNYLGTVRYIHTGQIALLVFLADDLAKGVPVMTGKVAEEGSITTTKSMVEWVTGLEYETIGPESMESIKSKGHINVWHGKVDPGQAIYIPLVLSLP